MRFGVNLAAARAGRRFDPHLLKLARGIVAVVSGFFMGLSLTVYEVVEMRQEQAAKLEALGREA